MTEQEITELAIKAGAEFLADTIIVNGKDAHDFVVRLANLVAKAEREACEKACWDHERDDEESLKPCPFCGAAAEIITLEGETDEPSIGAQCVQCTSTGCGAASGLIYPLMDDVTQLLIERWNKRSN